jgi:hypothetical protein
MATRFVSPVNRSEIAVARVRTRRLGTMNDLLGAGL